MQYNKRFSLYGALFTAALGTVLHFFYALCKCRFAAVFASVNESTWEHMKLLFWPMAFYSVFEYIRLRSRDSAFLPVRIFSTAVALLFIPTAYYTYTGVLGKSYTAVNVSIFYVAVAIGFFLWAKWSSNPPKCFRTLLVSVIADMLLLLMLFSFLTFSKYPPHIPLFQDPRNGTFGLLQSVFLLR